MSKWRDPPKQKNKCSFRTIPKGYRASFKKTHHGCAFCESPWLEICKGNQRRTHPLFAFCWGEVFRVLKVIDLHAIHFTFCQSPLRETEHCLGVPSAPKAPQKKTRENPRIAAPFDHGRCQEQRADQPSGEYSRGHTRVLGDAPEPRTPPPPTRQNMWVCIFWGTTQKGFLLVFI